MLERNETSGVPGAFVVIGAFKLRAGWGSGTNAFYDDAVREFLGLLTGSSRQVDVELYISRGLKAEADFFLRVRAYDLAEAQGFLEDFGHIVVGRFSEPVHSLVGMNRARQYITAEKSPALAGQLNSSCYTGDLPRFAIVIPVKKSARWWSLPESERMREIEAHTQASMPYLDRVKRELYHSTGLDDLDFITYFETADLAAFQELAVRLVSLPENEFHVRWGMPTLVGAIHSVADAVMKLRQF